MCGWLATLIRADDRTLANPSFAPLWCARQAHTSGVSTAPAIGRHALVGDPHALRQPAGLEEHVDRDAAARIPVTADAQEFRLDLARDPLANHHCAILVEGAVIAEARDIKLQRLRFQQPLARYIVDHEMREIR